jgi:hypothetical protein
MVPSAQALRCSRVAFRSVSLMSRCHPEPRPRKCSIRSRSRRMEISCLVGAFCGPRERRYAATISGATSVAGRMRLKCSSVSSSVSGSFAMPAPISASSSGVGTMTRPKRLSLTVRFILPNLPLVSLAERNEVGKRITWSVDQHVQPGPDLAERNHADFSIIPSQVRKEQCGTPVEILRNAEIDLMPREIDCALCLGPGILPRTAHRVFCIYNLCLGQSRFKMRRASEAVT